MLKEPKLIQLPKIEDQRGNLSFFEGENHIPFVIRRSYWIYDVPGGESRGGHAYYTNEEFIVALSGSFDVHLTDGTTKLSFHLNRSYFGLYIPELWWREIDNFSTNSVSFIVGSTPFSENDYIRDFSSFDALQKEEII